MRNTKEEGRERKKGERYYKTNKQKTNNPSINEKKITMYSC